MKLFSNVFSELSGFKNILECLDKKISPVSVTGLSHIHRACLVSALVGNRVNLVITGTEAESKKLCEDINIMTGRESAVLFPSREQVFTPVDSSNHEYE
jgi:transcription-repair coupling factor (superfamily II helicase)